MCLCHIKFSAQKPFFFQAGINTDEGLAFQVALQVKNKKLIFRFCDVNSCAFNGTCNSLFFPNSDVCKNKDKPIWAKQDQGIGKDGIGAKATVEDRQLQREICFEMFHLILLICTEIAAVHRGNTALKVNEVND